LSAFARLGNALKQERDLDMVGVTGSIPVVPTISKNQL
jgi:hypothetical protein